MSLGAAIETRLLQMLAEEPMDGKHLAQALNIPGKRGHYWLQLLAELGVLEIEPPSENAAPRPFLEWAFLESLKDPDFGFPTVAQAQTQLVQAGFHLLRGEYTLLTVVLSYRLKKIKEQHEMSSQPLSNALVKDILDYLDCPAKAPTLRYLNRLIQAYTHKVPWESVSRILKRHTMLETRDCPRLPEEFWSDAMRHGFGGTCYESSLAFYSLLTALGYEGYLTVNDMGDSRGCHAAIVLLLGGQKYLVDNTIPVHVAVRLDPHKTVRRNTTFANYTIRPVQENKYEVERSHHPHRNAFTLIDIPINLNDYQKILENDYTENGFFLKSVVMVKAIDGKTWRFFSDHQPYRLESFNRAGKREEFLEPEVLPYRLAGLFQIPEDRIVAALSWIQDPPVKHDNQNMIPPVVMEGRAQ